jgi:N-acetylneuraminic acid mutarotase
MPTARNDLAAVAVNVKIYAIGGIGGSGNTVEVYDPSSNSWSTAANMPTARYALTAAAAVKGKLTLIYAIGGSNGSVLNTVEVYSPSSNSWGTAANMPTPRDFLAAGSANGEIYAIGGLTGRSVLDTVEVYDPSSNSSSTAASLPSATDSLAAADVGGFVYAIGGRGRQALGSSAVEQYWPPRTLYTFTKN